ncbi:hypothetical protein [Nitrosomonas aestuarii]|nr:hypothetical protein [Nitrosomonas aestuarii]
MKYLFYFSEEGGRMLQIKLDESDRIAAAVSFKAAVAANLRTQR